VGNTKEFGLVRPAPATMFVPAAQVQDGLTAIVNRMIPVIWVVRTTGDARSLARAVQRDLLAVATQEAPDNFRTMRDVLSASIAQQRFNICSCRCLPDWPLHWEQSDFMVCFPILSHNGHTKSLSEWPWVQ